MNEIAVFFFLSGGKGSCAFKMTRTNSLKKCKKKKQKNNPRALKGSYIDEVLPQDSFTTV